jgi:hypothetical protein
MKKALSLDEFQVLIKRVLESGEKITLQSNASTSSPKLSINVPITSCRRISNGIQFHVNGGYINVEFEFDDFINWDFPEEEKTMEFHFEYDDDEPKGYWIRFAEFKLFFPEKGFKKLLNNIREETRKQREQDNIDDEIRGRANRFIDQETWASIDNMLEK